jgi:ubiquinone/menaquinone biosynthesis C-methylase UbiE
MPTSTANHGAPACRQDQQNKVDRYFQSQALFWRDIYLKPDVYSVIHQQRRELALAWVDTLHLAPQTPVLEAGCGAGAMAVALAHRGLEVCAVDSVPAMVDLTRRLAAAEGVENAVGASLGDVYHLEFSAGEFSLVVALGVLPWLDSPGSALREMARVLRPGGYVLASADNLWRSNCLLDPVLWLRPQAGRTLRRLGILKRPAAPPTQRLSRRRFEALLQEAGLEPVRHAAVGFGPFSLLGWPFLPDPMGVRLHFLLQRLAARGAPLLGSSGAQHLVLAKKPGDA